MNLKKIVKVLMSKSVGTGPLSYEKRIYRAAVSQRLRNTAPHWLPYNSIHKLRQMVCYWLKKQIKVLSSH